MGTGTLGRLFTLREKAYRAKQRRSSHVFDRLAYLLLRDELYLPELQPGAKVLDIGCGIGRDIRLLQKSGFECWGLESNQQLASLVEQSGIPVFEGLYEDLALPPGFF